MRMNDANAKNFAILAYSLVCKHEIVLQQYCTGNPALKPGYLGQIRRAAPLTPLKSPHLLTFSGVSKQSENTHAGSSAAAISIMAPILDTPPPKTIASGSAMLMTVASDFASLFA